MTLNETSDATTVQKLYVTIHIMASKRKETKTKLSNKMIDFDFAPTTKYDVRYRNTSIQKDFSKDGHNVYAYFRQCVRSHHQVSQERTDSTSDIEK